MVTLIRGLPGSGKSTYAKTLNVMHLEADMYHMINGVYKFREDKIKSAHTWCQFMFEQCLKRGMDVAVSNTFTTLWELQPYIDLCKKYNIEYKVIAMKTDYGSIHNVPLDIIQKMRNRWQDYPSEIIVSSQE